MRRRSLETYITVVVFAAMAADELCAHHAGGRTTEDLVPLEVRVDVADGRWLAPNGRLEVHVNRQLDPSRERLAILIADSDWTGLFSTSGTTLAYHGSPLRLPSGESPLVVYLVSPENEWQAIAHSVLRVLTPEGFEKAEVAPKLSFDNKGQLTEHHQPDENAPPRDTFQDLSVNAGFRSTHVRGGVTTSSQVNLLGVSNQPEALRFGTEGEAAPKVDLADYLVRVETRRVNVTVGHVPLNLHRYLVAEFASRGVSTTLRLARSELTLAALNGNGIVGFSNLLGLNNQQNQVRLLRVGTELVAARPGGARVELLLMDGSLLPRSGFTQERIADAEKARGGGVRFVGSTRGQRARIDTGYARSRFTNVPDPTLAGGLTLTPLRPRTNDAQYFDASYDLAKGARPAGTFPTNLTASYRFERVEPLYRTVGKPQAVAADVFRNTVEISGALGPAIGQISHARSHDNLERVSSLLTTNTRVTNATLVVPLALLPATDRAVLWMPLVSYTLGQTSQVGDGIPPNGGFASASQVPNQLSVNHVLRTEWTLGTVRPGYLLNVSRIDNRQQDRERSDFETVVHQMSFAASPATTIDLSFDVARERATSFERGTVTRISRFGFNGSWRITTSTTVSSILGRTSIDDPVAGRNNAMDVSVQYTQALPMLLDRRGASHIRAFTRWNWQSAEIFNVLVGLNDSRHNWAINSGLSVGLF